MLDQLRSQIGQSVRSLWARPDPAPAAPRRSSAAPVKPAAPPAPPPVALEGEALRVQQMQQALYRLLTRHAETRQFMRHLGLVERTMRKEGLDAVEALPASVIQQALEQLEQLVGDWSRSGLAEMRMRLQVMVDGRSTASQAFAPTAPAALAMCAAPHEPAEPAFAAAAGTPTSPAATKAMAMRTPIAPTGVFHVATAAPEAVEIDELSDKDRAAFEEMERSWAGRLPDGMAEVIAAARRVA